jgi:hypothetical protein
MEYDTVGLVERPNEVAELSTQHALERARPRSDDMHIESSVTE